MKTIRHLLALAFTLVASFAPAAAQTVAPFYAGTYSLVNLGQAADVPAAYGGLTFKPGDPTTLLIGGSANGSGAKIYSVAVVRDVGGHITGFTGSATIFATAQGTSGGIDGGLTFGPDGVLFYTSYSSNEIGEIKPGSTGPDKLVNLTALGVTSSVGSLVFVPAGFPGAGRVKLLSYNASTWYDAEAVADGAGTFDFANVGPAIDISTANGPEGATYISTANPLFTSPSVLVAAYGAGKVVAYDVDANGDPITATVRDFMTGLSGAEGATIDPVTGDFLFSTFGGGNQVIAVRGFTTPPDTDTLAPTLIAPLENATVGTPIAVTYSLPEAALAGSVEINFHDAAQSVEVFLTPDTAGESVGSHTYNIVTANPGSSAGIVAASGGPILDGSYTVLISYQDALGNARAFDSNLNVTVNAVPDEVTHTALYTKGDVLPTAGIDPYIPAGATWFGFGIPVVDEGGHVGVIARWKNPPGSAGAYGSGLFVDGALKVYVGQAVPGIPDATFKKFRDPVMSGQHLALVATIQGTGVVSTNDTVVIRVRPTGEVTVLAREGAVAAGTGGSVFKAFKSVNIAGGFSPVGPTGILYTAQLDKAAGVPATSDNDFGAWLFRNDVTTLAVREGGAATGLGVGETVKTFTLLKAASGSAGQGRGQLEPELVSFTAKTSTGRSVLLRYDTGVLTAFAIAGDVLGGATLPLAQWKSFGLLSESSVALAQRGIVENNVGGVTGSAAKGIFLGSTAGNVWEPVVQVGGATGITDVTFKSLKDPALAADSAAVAFPAALEGTGVTSTNDASIWWQPDGGALTLLAREGDTALGGGTWKAFTSLAIPGGATGPLFLATLSGVPKTADSGVWAVDSGDALRVLFREGDTIVGKTVKALAVLKAVAGSPGSAHAFHSNAQVVWRAAFTDGTTAIVKTHVP